MKNARILLPLLAISFTGCASTWDNFSSRQYRSDVASNPMRLFSDEDPMTVLRTSTDGHARAKAMLKLEQPNSPQEANEALGYLSDAAIKDTSPVVRSAAIDALGRFNDPQTFNLLYAAYQQSNGPQASQTGITNLYNTNGYSPEVITMLKSRALESMAKTGRPEAVRFVAEVAMKQEDIKNSTTVDRDVRLAAVRSLGMVKTKESAQILLNIMNNESIRDTAVSNRAHEGLVKLTGANYQPGDAKWSEIAQSGFVTNESSGGIIETVSGWFKN
jgi:hypothetical protein